MCFHGIALNINPAMADFELLDPCGMPGVISTSIASGARPPDRTAVDRRGRDRRRDLRPSLRPAPWRGAGRRAAGLTARWPPACSSCVVTRSPAGGLRRSSIAPSIATGSPGRPPAVDQEDGCQNCREPAGDGVRLRILKDFAFHVVGTEAEARQLDRSLAQVAIEQARASGSWRTVVAPPGEHRPLQAVGDELIGAMLRVCRDAIAEASRAGQTAYLQVVQNWGAQAGARTGPPVPRPVRPAPGAASRRRGDRRGGPLRDPRR